MQVEYRGFGSCSGYGIAAKDYALALNRVGVDVVYCPIDSTISPFYRDEERKQLKALRGHPSKEAVQILHCIPNMQVRFQHKMKAKSVGFATFESTRAPGHWIDWLNKNSMVITPSQFCHDTFSSKVSNLEIIPHCLDTEYWYPRPGVKNKRFTYIAIGSWTERKGWHALMSAWRGMEDCDLIIVTDYKDKARNKFEGFSNVSYQDKIVDMASLMSSADCVVCPTRGEGFGLVGLQALALALPLIITDWSGVKQYADSTNACMLPYERIAVKPSMDKLFQFKNQEWAFVSPDILRDKMRDVFSDYTEFKNRAQVGCQMVRDKLSYEVVGTEFKNRLESL
jgi:glycosyltransferase involved in cell wall biosynthesis